MYPNSLAKDKIMKFFLYTSVLNFDHADATVVSDIIRVARYHNALNGITGVLYLMEKISLSILKVKKQL